MHNATVEKVIHYKKTDILFVLEQGQRTINLAPAYSEHNSLNEPNFICKQGKITPILSKKQFILSIA